MFRIKLVLLNYFCCLVSGSSDLFLIHNYDKSEYYCVTNSSDAITWIDEDGINPNSEFISSSHPNNNIELTLDGLKLKTFSNLWGYIIDRRWEEFEIIKTTPILKKEEKLNFTLIPKRWYIIIRWSFSLRTDKEAHLFFCDGDDITKSNCYWILLGASNGTKIALRKCSKGQISHVESKNLCVTNLVEYPSQNVLSSKFWTHFEFYMHEQKYVFLYEEGRAVPQKLLQFDEETNTLDISSVFVHSKEVNAFWKFHFYKDYFFSEEEKENIRLEPILNVADNKICISFFVFMGHGCKLKVTLSDANDIGNVIKEQIYSSKRVFHPAKLESYSGIDFNEWFEIKFLANNIKINKVVLLLNTFGCDAKSREWYIHKIRLCQESEYRMITSQSNLNCQLVTSSQTYNFNESKEVVARPSNCPPNTIGLSCVPCSGNCGRSKICEHFENNEIKCTCSEGHYGNNCWKCQECIHGTCDSVNGTCLCEDDYYGTKCQIEKTLIFDKAPEVENIRYTEVSVSLNSFHIRDFNTENPRQYRIQYKKAENIHTWIEIEQTYISSNSAVVKIENLEPGTQYFVRSVIIGKSGEKVESDLIPYKEFYTLCDAISEQSVHIEPRNISADLTILKKTDRSCTFKNYRIILNGTDVQATFITANNITLNSLTPFTIYEVKLQGHYTIKKSFKTKEGIPGKIQHLSSVLISPTKVQVQWEEPKYTHGKPIQYIVEYEHVSYIKCGTTLSNKYFPNITSTAETVIILDKLEPYSKYLISVSARNLKFRGISEVIYQVTSGVEDIIYENEIPELQNITPNIYSVETIFSRVLCSKIRGLLSLNLTATCLNEWCHKISQSLIYSFNQTVYTLENLQPFSSYTLNINFCRNVICRNITSKTIQTKPTIPSPVEGLSVYTKNTSSISLRWIPPYPPTGIIEYFKIKYGICGEDLQEIKIVEGVRCQIWTNYNCLTITDLEKSQNYCIKAIVKNQNVDFLRETKEISTLTAIKQPDAPYHLYVKWSINNDLKLRWKHPNQSNGDIKYFRILIETQPLDVSYSISKLLALMHGSHQLVYQYNITHEVIKPSTQFEVRIAADNGMIGKELKGEFISPPSIPVFVNDPKISTSETKINISISLKNSHKIFLFASNNNNSEHTLNTDLEKFENEFHLLPKYGIVCECELNNFSSFSFTIGDENSVCNKSQFNFPLLPNNDYNITILLINSFRNTNSYKILSYTVSTESRKGINSLQMYLLITGFVLIIITTVGCLLYFLFKKRKTVVVSGLDNSEQIPLRSRPNDYTDRKTLAIKFDTENFEKYVKDSLEDGKLLKEHEMILQSYSQPMYEELNKTFSYEYIPSHSENIHGIVSNGYILVKMLQSEFYKDFWTMVWKENVENMVFIDSISSHETEIYWPEENAKMEFDNISVQFISSQDFRYYKLKRFMLSYQDRTVYVNQFHLTSISQNKLPNSLSTFVHFFQEMSKILLKSTSPVLVHSRSGLAESGFILLCDICIRTAKNEGSVDVTHTTQVLGNCKIELIQDSKYFLLAHLVILEVLLTQDTKIKSENNNYIQKEEIMQQMQYMNRMVSLDESLRKIEGEEYLTMTAGSIYENETKNYIIDNVNTCLLDCFRDFKNVITTHQPNSQDVINFWKMIQNHKVSVIVSLNETPQDECAWLPSQNKPLTLPTVTITLKNTKKLQGYVWMTVQIEDKLYKYTVEIFLFNNWTPKVSCPNDFTEFVKFCIETYCILTRSDFILVMCRDGVTATGIFVANLLNIEMITAENAYDVCSAVRTVKSYNSNFIINEEQFLFLWKVAKNYMNENQLYEKK